MPGDRELKGNFFTRAIFLTYSLLYARKPVTFSPLSKNMMSLGSYF